MTESTLVNEWKAEGMRQGERKAMRYLTLRLLQLRHGGASKDLAKAIRSCDDLENLNSWIDAAIVASSLDDFRRLAGL